LLDLLFLRGGGRRGLRFFLGLDELQERVAEQLLFEMLLQVEQRHVEQVHRLEQPRIDPQVLAQADVLVQAGLHAACPRRSRSRAGGLVPSSSGSCSRRADRCAASSGSVSRMAETLSSTLRRRNTEGSWARYPTPARARRYIGSSVMSRPSSLIVPRSGRTSPV